MIELLWLLLGVGLLVGGGEMLVRGASELARALGVSGLVIGLTVVAFGTSAPELAVNLSAALAGKGSISFGNVIGSNLANIGLILGCSALLRPIAVESRLIRRELPLMLLATTAVLVLALDPWLRGQSAVYDRSDGVVLWLLFGVFLYATVVEIFVPGRRDPVLQQSCQASPAASARPAWFSVVLVGVGLAGLLFGGRVTVDAAVSIARSLGVSEAVIALTVVALGTSLPELVTSVLATLRGASDLAVGNVIGSNLFNLLFVLGTTSIVRPVEVPVDGLTDLLALCLLSLLVLPLTLSHQRRVVRREGALLLVLWLGYTAWRSATAFTL